MICDGTCINLEWISNEINLEWNGVRDTFPPMIYNSPFTILILNKFNSGLDNHR